MSFLDRISSSQVRAHPFPHILVEDALPPALCDQLIAQFPSQEVISLGRRPTQTTKFYYHIRQANEDWRISPLWKKTLRELVQPDIWHHFMRIFGDSLLREYPDFEERYGNPVAFRVGNRRYDDFGDNDVLLDSKTLIHTPSAGEPEIERLPHLKFFSTVFLAYLFLRPDDDLAHGAEFDFYSIKDGERILLGPRHVAQPNQLTPETRIPYRKNTLVIFLNTARSFQAVAARSASNKPYMALHFTAHLRHFLYQHDFLPGARMDAMPAELMYPPYRPTVRDRVVYRWRRATGRL